MRSTMTSKGQITIPKELRDQLSLNDGTVIDWVIDETGALTGRVTQEAHNPFLAYLGAFPLPDGVSTEEFMLEMRGEQDEVDRGGPGAKIVALDDFLRMDR